MMNLLGAALVLGLLLTACGPTHEHQFQTWERDGDSHWQVCECGTASEPEAHAWNEESCCQQCGAAVMADADDSYSILIYDQQGNICQQTDYDAQGNVISEMGCETVYDAAGNPQHQKNYYDGVLESEYFYQPNGEGEVYMSQEILYASDCKYISEYDENWNLLSHTTCDLEGMVLSQEVYELEYDHQGNVAKTTCYTDGELSNISQDFLGPDGSLYNISNIYYENGQVVYAMANEYEFDETGCLMEQREYVNDILSHQITYHGNADDGYYLAYEAAYDETGSLLWEKRYDTQGNLIPV